MRTALLISAAILLFPSFGWARGQETHTVIRTAYFPMGQGPVRGSVVRVDSKQGRGSYTGARKTYVNIGKRNLTKAELDAMKRRYKFQDRKFGVHRTWTCTVVKKNNPY
jgi:hypothetical protein